jgi:hypothetical protein
VGVGELAPYGSAAASWRDERRRRGMGACGRFARLAATYLLLFAYVAPPPLTGAAAPAANGGQKLGCRQRGKGRPTAAAHVRRIQAADRFRGPDPGPAVAADSHRTLLSAPAQVPALSPNSSILSRVFRPLRC